MTVNEELVKILGQAFHHILRQPEQGAVAFVRCLPSDVSETFTMSSNVHPQGWKVYYVGNATDFSKQFVTAGQAVEIREKKKEAVLFLINTEKAGAGMDGVYSASREVDEKELFTKAIQLALTNIENKSGEKYRKFAEESIKKAQGDRRRATLSYWSQLYFLVSTLAEQRFPGELLHLVGLWPVQNIENLDHRQSLSNSKTLVERLLGRSSTTSSIDARVETINLKDPTPDQLRELKSFLREAEMLPPRDALELLNDKPSLWINNLRIGDSAELKKLILVPWRNPKTEKINKWSGLRDREKDSPEYIVDTTQDQTRPLEVRWKTEPSKLKAGSVEYNVIVEDNLEEELVSRRVPHGQKDEQRCRFDPSDFELLGEEFRIPAKVVINVVDNDGVEPIESEEFYVCSGSVQEEERQPPKRQQRCVCEGLIDLETWKDCTEIVESHPAQSHKEFVQVYIKKPSKCIRIHRPKIIRLAEENMKEHDWTLGRWIVRVRDTGEMTSKLEFVPFSPPSIEDIKKPWERVQQASRDLLKAFGEAGAIGQVYDLEAELFEKVNEYLLSWYSLLCMKRADPEWALAHTIQINSQSGKTLGLIVLPTHPLRMAWYAAYDNLLLHARYEDKQKPKEIRETVKVLDGAMFPPFLPGVDDSGTFVFADTLGFHAIGMVRDKDPEPKATVALMSRVVFGKEKTEDVPSIGLSTSEVIGKEILKYMEAHDTSRILHIHALRPGDGMTVTRALGYVCEKTDAPENDENEEDAESKNSASSCAFVLNIYPSEAQRAISGRFLLELIEKRRTGSLGVQEEDRWTLESWSLPGNMRVPRLRWARKEKSLPDSAAHLSIAFDSFNSEVVTEPITTPIKRPFAAFGLLNAYERQFCASPEPEWKGYIPDEFEGEKHPAKSLLTDRIIGILGAILCLVAKSISRKESNELPTLKTTIPPDKENALRQLHQLSDWVITVDRNAGVEYFDSPRENKTIYDTYVIDCVPERHDLGCLQLITSTGNLDEVRNLLEHALDKMGLSVSLRNAEFLLEHLKALSGRLAIRLTGNKHVSSEMVALALTYASCKKEDKSTDTCWLRLEKGFFIPIDEIRDLLPETDDNGMLRPDLIHVSAENKKRLVFRFVEVKYRQDLRSARNPELLNKITEQIESFRKRWEEYYLRPELPALSRSIRRARLAQVLRFYAEKARRHYLEEKDYEELMYCINIMVKEGAKYNSADSLPHGEDRGYIFCPEYRREKPEEIAPKDYPLKIFLFGGSCMPDSPRSLEQVFEEDFQSEPTLSSEEPTAITPAQSDNPETVKDQRDFPESLSIRLGKNPKTDSEVFWNLSVKGHPHLMIVGQSGMGKTTCLINICKQSVEQNCFPIVFSFHQDIDERFAKLFERVRLIECNNLGYNPLAIAKDRTGERSYLDVASNLRDIFAAIYPELGDVQLGSIREAIKESYEEKGWSKSAENIAEAPRFGRFLEILEDKAKKEKKLETLLMRLRELRDYGLFDITSSEQSILTFNEPVLIKLHTTQNELVQRAFSFLNLYAIYKEMFYQGLKQRLERLIIFDEAHRAAKLVLISKMVQEARKYGIGIVLASQQAVDFDDKLFNLIGTYLVLHLTDKDAKALVKNVFTSDKHGMLIDDVKSLEKYQGLFCAENRKPQKLRLENI